MTTIALRAQIFHLISNPFESSNSYQYFEDGLLVVENGIVKEVGPFKDLKDKHPQFEDHSGKLIIPGFIDTHIHYPQTEMVGSYGEQLLEWLEQYTFPLEKKFKDKEYADRVAKIFIDELLKNGTTTALVFPTVHPESVDAFFEEAEKRNLRMISGKVLMDRHAPEELCDTPVSAYQDSKELIKKWHGKGRLLYAVTPRFAPTSSEEQLLKAKQLLEEHPDVYMHTHLSENKAEIEWVKELFPKSDSYLGVYQDHGLVRKRSVFAHCIHLEDKDFKCLSDHEASISFCATSNMFLGSGFFKLDKANQHKVRVGLGTDIGAGTSFCHLQTMNESYKIIKQQKSLVDDPKSIHPLTSVQAFYLATLGGAKSLHLEDKLGNLEKGKEADFLVLDPKATPFLQARIENTNSIEEVLFALMMIADPSIIQDTYIMGQRV